MLALWPSRPDALGGENPDDRWRASRDVDDELPVFCPECAEREFGDWSPAQAIEDLLTREGALPAILVSRLRTLCSVSSKRTTVPLQLTCSRGSHGQQGEAERER